MILPVDQTEWDDLDGHHVRMSLTLLGIGPEGLEWLEEHAPGWREHVSAREVRVDDIVPHVQIMSAPFDILRSARARMTFKLAEDIIRQFEPMAEIDPAPA